ncbi:MAG: hypothetical protein ABIP64_16935 [Burkholderiales bacterium]
MKTYLLIFAVLMSWPVATFAEQPASIASQCVVGSVKISWRPSKRCTVFNDQATFKAAMDALGWQVAVPLKIDWTREALVFDSGDNPYGNAIPICTGLFADAAKKAATLRWAWKENVVPSSTARAKAKADKAEPSATSDKSIVEKAKESFSNVPEEGKQKLNDLVEDMKKFPSPVPKRAAVIAVFPKPMQSNFAKIDCAIQK